LKKEIQENAAIDATASSDWTFVEINHDVTISRKNDARSGIQRYFFAAIFENPNIAS